MLVSQKFLIFIVDSGAQLPTKFNRKGASTMKKLKKRLLAAALTSMAAATMAMPSFATEWTFKPYWPTQQSSNYLNINRPGSGVNMKGKNLTLYRTSNPGFDQKFTVNKTAYNGKPCTYYMRTENGVTYAINRSSSSGHNAIMWPLSEGKYDSAFIPAKSDPSMVANLLHYDEGMTFDSDSPGSMVYFNKHSGSWEVSG